MAKLDYTTSVTTLQGETHDLSEYAGKVLLIVNTASKCRFTPQFEGLEQIWQRYGDRGLVVLGFPCNQFRNQEPGNNSEIESFCQINYGVSFPMHTKIDVNGSNAHPLYRQLKRAKPGLFGSKGIKWNFTKFLVRRDGEILARYAFQVTPESLTGDIEGLLG